MSNQLFIARKAASDSTYDEGRWWIQNGILGPGPEHVVRQFVDIVGGGFKLESVGTARDVLLKLGLLAPQNERDEEMLADHAAFLTSQNDIDDEVSEPVDPLAGLVVTEETSKETILGKLAKVAVPEEQLASFEYGKAVQEMKEAGIDFSSYGWNHKPKKEQAFRAYVLFKGQLI